MNKRLIILDLDNTLVDTLSVWGASLSCLIGNLAGRLSVPLEISHDLIRRAHGQHRFNDGVSLVDWMLEQEHGVNLRGAWEDVAFVIQTEWLRQSSELTVPYSGAIEALKNWREDGFRIAIQTDAEDCAVLRRLWCMACHAVESGDLSKPRDILDLIDKIYCQPSIPHSSRFLSEVGAEFREDMSSRIYVWKDKQFKPSLDHLRHILVEQDVAAEDAIYVGDSHKDGAEAGTLSVAFAWARYGAKVSPEVLALYALVGSRNYSYGELTVLDAMKQMGVIPAHIFQESLLEKYPHTLGGTTRSNLSVFPSLQIST